MKKMMAGVGLVLALGACNSKPTANPTTQRDAATAQQIVQGCITKGNVLTKAGRETILGCIAPKGHEQAFTTCAQAAMGADGFLTKPARTKLENDITVCLEKNR